jgi:hypothetical protein
MNDPNVVKRHLESVMRAHRVRSELEYGQKVALVAGITEDLRYEKVRFRRSIAPSPRVTSGPVPLGGAAGLLDDLLYRREWLEPRTERHIYTIEMEIDRNVGHRISAFQTWNRYSYDQWLGNTLVESTGGQSAALLSAPPVTLQREALSPTDVLIVGGIPGAVLATGVVLTTATLLNQPLASNPYIALFVLLNGIVLCITSLAAVKERNQFWGSSSSKHFSLRSVPLGLRQRRRLVE